MKLLERKQEEKMPKGTKVERLYEKLKSQGKSKGSAAAIAQSVTGLSLKTGKKSKNALRKMAGE